MGLGSALYVIRLRLRLRLSLRLTHTCMAVSGLVAVPGARVRASMVTPSHWDLKLRWGIELCRRGRGYAEGLGLDLDLNCDGA